MQRHDLGGFDLLVLGAAAVLALPSGAVWLGAGLAALASGAGWSGSPGDAASALFSLPGHLSDPAAAWPGEAREGLPGPFLYWPATALAVLAVVAVLALALRWWARPSVGSVPRFPLGVEGRARFAKRRDLAPLVVPGPRRGRFILGTAHGHLVATEEPAGANRSERSGDRGAVALVGPSRSGKTTAAISAILEWEGPAVLASVKSDLLGATQRWRAQHGDVAVFDPTGTTGRPCATWSPLRDAGTTLGAQRAARALCDAAPRGGVEGGLDFWLVQAEILLSGLLYVARHAGFDMATVCEWVMTQDRPGDHGPGVVRGVLDALLNPEGEDDPAAEARATETVPASQALLSIWAMEERTRSSVYATAQTVVWPWADPGVAAAGRGEGVHLDWLLSGPNTLYLCAPIEDQARLAPAFGGLLNDLIKQAYLRVAATGRPLDPPLLLVIDEAGNTPLRSLPEYASTLAGIGVLLVTIWQSVAQIEATYGRQADTILTNHLSKVFYAGLSDPASLRYIATVLGDTEVEALSRTTVPGGIRASDQLATNRVALAPAHALRQMRPGDALLLHGTLPPAQLRTRPYYLDPQLSARATPAPDGLPVRSVRALVPTHRR